MANCEKCGKKIGLLSAYGDGLCADCYAADLDEKDKLRMQDDARSAAEAVAAREAAARIILTTETAHNLPVESRLGIVTAEYVLGMHLFKDVASSFRDVFGGRSDTMQKGLRIARESALTELRAEALALGADAVVGVDLDYSEISGGGKSMLFLVASGTAVKLANI